MSWVLVAISLLLAPSDAREPQCAGCHPSQAQAHARSRHSLAWINPLFQHEYNERPKRWCVSCHAPEISDEMTAAPPNALASKGVSCVGCHRKNGEMVSRARSRWSPHNTTAISDFGSANDCAGCHQFNFPVLDPSDGALIRATDVPMQNTGDEARALGGQCETCHDPHRAAGSHDRDTLMSAMSVELCQDKAIPGDVVLAIRNRGAGHNLPTGGVHRAIRSRVWRSSAPANVVTDRLGREFELSDSSARRVKADTTIPFGQTRRLQTTISALGGERDEPINAEIQYRYALRDGARRIDGSSAVQTLTRLRIRPSKLVQCSL